MFRNENLGLRAKCANGVRAEPLRSKRSRSVGDNNSLLCSKEFLDERLLRRDDEDEGVLSESQATFNELCTEGSSSSLVSSSPSEYTV